MNSRNLFRSVVLLMVLITALTVFREVENSAQLASITAERDLYQQLLDDSQRSMDPEYRDSYLIKIRDPFGLIADEVVTFENNFAVSHFLTSPNEPFAEIPGLLLVYEFRETPVMILPDGTHLALQASLGQTINFTRETVSDGSTQLAYFVCDTWGETCVQDTLITINFTLPN